MAINAIQIITAEYPATRSYTPQNRLFQDYCFGTLIKERVRFMCSVLVSVQGLLFRHMDQRTR